MPENIGELPQSVGMMPAKKQCDAWERPSLCRGLDGM